MKTDMSSLPETPPEHTRTSLPWEKAQNHHVDTEPTDNSLVYPEFLRAALHSREWSDVALLLAQATDIQLEKVVNALSAAQPRTITSLAWKAGLDTTDAWTLQVDAAGIDPSEAFSARSDGAFALNESEMEWQISFLARRV